MPKSDLDLPPGDYALVADRIALFYRTHPGGRIITELVSRTPDEVTFRALVYRTAEEPHPAATGWASEREGDGAINTVACLENTETSAIGRALANLGFLASVRRPSAEEMAKADAARRRGSGRPSPGRGETPRAGSPPPSLAVVSSAPPGSSLQPEVDPQGHADMVADLLTLLRDAERAGIRPARAEAIRHALLHTVLERETLRRVEDGLRAFLARRTANRLANATRERITRSVATATPRSDPSEVRGHASPVRAEARRVAEGGVSWGGVSSAADGAEGAARPRAAQADESSVEERRDGGANGTSAG